MAKKQKIQIRLTVEEQIEHLKKITTGKPIVPQQGFITPEHINRIYNSEESDSFIYGVERYFKSLRDVTNSYVEQLADPKMLSAKGKKTFENITKGDLNFRRALKATSARLDLSDLSYEARKPIYEKFARYDA